MRLVLDTCVRKGAVDELRFHHRDVVWVGEWPTEHGDDEMPAFAFGESRVRVTLDKDFGEMAVPSGSPTLESFGASTVGSAFRQRFANRCSIDMVRSCTTLPS